MERRTAIKILGGAAAWPLAAQAQKPAMPVIGFLHSGSPDENTKRLAAFRKGLGNAGFVEGQNVAIEYRWAFGKNGDLPALAADLVRMKVALIATPGSTPAAVVAKAATASIPIVIGVGADPVSLGLVTSLSRPDGNVTGITSLNAELVAKRLGLFRDLAPDASRYFVLANPASVLAAPFIKDLETAAASIGSRVGRKTRSGNCAGFPVVEFEATVWFWEFDLSFPLDARLISFAEDTRSIASPSPTSQGQDEKFGCNHYRRWPSRPCVRGVYGCAGA
jgi:ABC-type uncharacterized transport system substrate-binding protein